MVYERLLLGVGVALPRGGLGIQYPKIRSVAGPVLMSTNWEVSGEGGMVALVSIADRLPVVFRIIIMVWGGHW